MPRLYLVAGEPSGDLYAGALTSEKLVSLYLARIAAYDKSGPAINAAGYERGPIDPGCRSRWQNSFTKNCPTTRNDSCLDWNPPSLFRPSP